MESHSCKTIEFEIAGTLIVFINLTDSLAFSATYSTSTTLILNTIHLIQISTKRFYFLFFSLRKNKSPVITLFISKSNEKVIRDLALRSIVDRSNRSKPRYVETASVAADRSKLVESSFNELSVQRHTNDRVTCRQKVLDEDNCRATSWLAAINVVKAHSRIGAFTIPDESTSQ